jgi:hypothetical protein
MLVQKLFNEQFYAVALSETQIIIEQLNTLTDILSYMHVMI